MGQPDRATGQRSGSGERPPARKMTVRTFLCWKTSGTKAMTTPGETWIILRERLGPVAEVLIECVHGEKQILRLTTPKLDPKEQRTFFGAPEKRLGPRSLRMTTRFCDVFPGHGTR